MFFDKSYFKKYVRNSVITCIYKRTAFLFLMDIIINFVIISYSSKNLEIF